MGRIIIMIILFTGVLFRDNCENQLIVYGKDFFAPYIIILCTYRYIFIVVSQAQKTAIHFSGLGAAAISVSVFELTNNN
jgi:hypothetical protein